LANVALSFSNVSTEINALAGYDPGWWALGKLYSYSVQQDPFVHIDSDVYLWKLLPSHLESADVFTQNPESFPEVGDAWYQPARVDRAFLDAGEVGFLMNGIGIDKYTLIKGPSAAVSSADSAPILSAITQNRRCGLPWNQKMSLHGNPSATRRAI